MGDGTVRGIHRDILQLIDVELDVELTIEDDPGDALVTPEARAGGRVTNQSRRVVGVKARSVLRRGGGFGHASRPDLVKLDPKKDERKVFAEG